MNTNIFEMYPSKKEGVPYEQYLEFGGIINKKDFTSALTRAGNTSSIDNIIKTHGEVIARIANIQLQNTEETTDPRIVLYAILRNDVREEGVEYHHDNMGDQRLFAEALRMLGDTDSLNKMIEAYPNISFGDIPKKEAAEEETRKAA
jgi:hypothetical protein